MYKIYEIFMYDNYLTLFSDLQLYDYILIDNKNIFLKKLVQNFWNYYSEDFLESVSFRFDPTIFQNLLD